MQLKPNDTVYFHGKECTVVEANYLGIRLSTDDGLAFVKASKVATDVLTLDPTPRKQLPTKLPGLVQAYNRRQERIKTYVNIKAASIKRHREVVRLATEANLERKRQHMTTQLQQQIYSAINNATVADIKAWKTFVEEANAKVIERTKSLVQSQKQLLAEIEGIQFEQEAPKVSDALASAARITKDTILNAALRLNEEWFGASTLYDFLREGGFTGQKDRVGRHLKHLVAAGKMLMKHDEDCNMKFGRNLFSVVK